MESIHKWIVVVVAGLFCHLVPELRGQELSNRHLKIAYSDWTPFIMVDRDADGGQRCTGIVGEILNVMRQGVNSIESQQTFQQSFYSSVGHPVVLKTLLKILLKSLLRFN